MACLLEKVLVLISAREINDQGELQEEADKSKKKKYTASTSTLGRKIILSYEEAKKGMNTLNIILVE